MNRQAKWNEVNWKEQWKAFGHDYRNGYVHIHLKDFGFSKNGENSLVKLKPGPGFGDLSHPTTKLTLKFMAAYIGKTDSLLDIGCGSGILSLAAGRMGCKDVFGVDIDPEAIAHAKENAILNKLESNVHFCENENLKIPEQGSLLACMNMIRCEQMAAWESLKSHHDKISLCITSGILTDEKEEYLKQTTAWGWTLVEEREDAPWTAFVFNCRNKAAHVAQEPSF